MSNLDEDLSIASIAISGTVSKNADLANSFIFNNLFAKVRLLTSLPSVMLDI